MYWVVIVQFNCKSTVHRQTSQKIKTSAFRFMEAKIPLNDFLPIVMWAVLNGIKITDTAPAHIRVLIFLGNQQHWMIWSIWYQYWPTLFACVQTSPICFATKEGNGNVCVHVQAKLHMFSLVLKICIFAEPSTNCRKFLTN